MDKQARSGGSTNGRKHTWRRKGSGRKDLVKSREEQRASGRPRNSGVAPSRLVGRNSLIIHISAGLFSAVSEIFRGFLLAGTDSFFGVEISWGFLTAGTDSFFGVRNFSGALDGGHGFIFGCQKFLGVFDGGHGFIFWSQKFLSCS